MRLLFILLKNSLGSGIVWLLSFLLILTGLLNRWLTEFDAVCWGVSKFIDVWFETAGCGWVIMTILCCGLSILVESAVVWLSNVENYGPPLNARYGDDYLRMETYGFYMAEPALFVTHIFESDWDSCEFEFSSWCVVKISFVGFSAID